MRTGGILKVALMLGVVLALMASPAWADSIIGAVSATTNMGEQFPLVDAINQTGLTAHYISGVTNFDVFVPTTTHDSEPGNDFVAKCFGQIEIFGAVSTGEKHVTGDKHISRYLEVGITSRTAS